MLQTTIFVKADYAKRLTFARENGCNALTITGQCEPQQNKDFLRKIGLVNQGLKDPFPIVDIQTTGSDVGQRLPLLPKNGSRGNYCHLTDCSISRYDKSKNYRHAA